MPSYRYTQRRRVLREIAQRCTVGAPARLFGIGTGTTRERIQRDAGKTVFKEGTATSLTSPRHVTGVNNERDAESMFAVSVTLVLTLRRLKKALSL